MDTYTACMLIEEPSEDTTREDVIEAMQFLIDTGVVWSLQGFYGRAARSLIENGECHMR